MSQLRSFATSFVSLLCLACSDDANSSGPCAHASGQYRWEYTATSGNCGQIPDRTTNLDSRPEKPPSFCTSGEIRYSDDNCQVSYIDITCPLEELGPGLGPGTSTQNGTYTLAQDASTGTGKLTLLDLNPDGDVLCQGNYDLKLVRLEAQD
jgi:hypothetical protein